MAVSAGEVYCNPPCRQKIVVRTAAADTEGERSVLDLYVAPGGFAADYHVHPLSEERFTLVRGRLRVCIENQDVILERTGQTVAVPPGTTHRFFSASEDEETFAIVEFRNRADRFENLLLRQLFGLAEDGRSDGRGIPNLLQTSVTMLEFSDVLRFTSRPWPVQCAFYTALAPIARLLGYHGCNPVLESRPVQTTELEVLPPEVALHVNT
ncbi:cupin domain-containing protein [Streptomyces sp. RB6PN25]|uniref:Cupin domain-containing protein n=1 Tax=Streptomyces humicola TaxID=2953240 RepID=A0ABT1Q8N5_9ACTN|nr:cupin domain-containing protein [Streptomyces humicola]MCQ4085190.1 cupin domain-containing protein [Streptomyces humicola]